jgi:toxin ParE1/3/4
VKVVQRRRTTEDIDEHAAYIAARNPRAAYRFLDMLEETFDLLARHPRIGSRRLDHVVSGLRAIPVGTFPSYIVLYLVSGGRVQIVRIVHASRDLEALLKVPGSEPRQP